MVGAAWPAIAAPTPLEPVKLTRSTPGWVERRAAPSGPCSTTTFTTPGGRPASSAASPIASASSGVCGLGRSTTVHPAISAGTSFHTLVVNGKFDGVIAATTPTGSQRRVDTFTAPLPTRCGKGTSLCSHSGSGSARSTISRDAASPKPICIIFAIVRVAPASVMTDSVSTSLRACSASENRYIAAARLRDRQARPGTVVERPSGRIDRRVDLRHRRRLDLERDLLRGGRDHAERAGVTGDEAAVDEGAAGGDEIGHAGLRASVVRHAHTTERPERPTT